MVPSTEASTGEIKVVVNNVADLRVAAGKGFGTGLTFGLVGSTVTDFYEMQVTINANGKVLTRNDIKHALHSTIGNATPPLGLEPLSPEIGFGRVVEQMLLNALKDFQQSGELSSLRSNHPNMFAPLACL